MKKNDRNLFYSDYQSGGFVNPQLQAMPQANPQMMQPQMINPQMVNPQMMQPSGYMLNNNYMSYGPQANPYMQNTVPEQYINSYDETNTYETRLSKLERQVRKLEARVSRLETNTDVVANDSKDLYII